MSFLWVAAIQAIYHEIGSPSVTIVVVVQIVWGDANEIVCERIRLFTNPAYGASASHVRFWDVPTESWVLKCETAAAELSCRCFVVTLVPRKMVPEFIR